MSARCLVTLFVLAVASADPAAAAQCGDSVIEAPEECDDANVFVVLGDRFPLNGDGCDTNCEIESGWSCDGQPSSCSRLAAYSEHRYVAGLQAGSTQRFPSGFTADPVSTFSEGVAASEAGAEAAFRVQTFLDSDDLGLAFSGSNQVSARKGNSDSIFVEAFSQVDARSSLCLFQPTDYSLDVSWNSALGGNGSASNASADAIFVLFNRRGVVEFDERSEEISFAASGNLSCGCWESITQLNSSSRPNTFGLDPGGTTTQTATMSGETRLLLRKVPTPRVPILFAFDRPYPCLLEPATGFLDLGVIENCSGITPPSVGIDRRAVLAAARRFLDASNLDFIDVREGESDVETTVYFIDQAVVPDIESVGFALTGTDRFNDQRGGRAAVFVRPEWPPELIALASVHEAGHLFGLRHRDDALSDPRSIMNVRPSRACASDLEAPCRFFNVPETAGGFSSHNAEYHLRRWVGGARDECLQELGFRPGDWDTPGGALLDELVIELISPLSSLEGGRGVAAALAGRPGLMLYDARVLVGERGQPLTERVVLGNIPLAALEGLAVALYPGEVFTVTAASSPGGVRDIALADGDPFTLEGLSVGDSASVAVYLQTGGLAFETLAEGVVVVPEASALSNFLAAVLATLGLAGMRRWRVSRATSELQAAEIDPAGCM
jgi:cysteine-rich repeat protein